MIKIETGQQFPNTNELKEKLEAALASFHLRQRGKHILVAKKSLLIGAVIVRKKKCLQVSGNFPEFWLSMAFAIITVLLGIFLPVLLYFIFIHRKLKKAEKEVAACIQASVDRLKFE